MRKFVRDFQKAFSVTILLMSNVHYFAMLGADVSPELPTSDGRIDLVLKTVDCIFIFELKYGKDAVTAINQIEEKKYFFAFADDKRKKFLVGINFSDDSRTIDDWTVIGG